MKTYHSLAIVPAVAAGAVLILLVVTRAAELHPMLLRAEIETAKVLALVGCIIAASSFARGDYLRRAWLMMGASYAFLLARDATLFPSALRAIGAGGGQPIELTRYGLVLLSNVAGVLGAYLMARAWRVAGIELPFTRARQFALVAAVTIIALMITGPSLVLEVQGASRGDTRSVLGLISGAGDVLSLLFLAPVLLTAIALRGGLLLWPWALLTMSMFGWLCYDAAGTLGQLVAVDPTYLKAFEETWRAAACAYTLAAGIAQHRVMRDAESS